MPLHRSRSYHVLSVYRLRWCRLLRCRREIACHRLDFASGSALNQNVIPRGADLAELHPRLMLAKSRLAASSACLPEASRAPMSPLRGTSIAIRAAM